jgi:hypothetical protein
MRFACDVVRAKPSRRLKNAGVRDWAGDVTGDKVPLCPLWSLLCGPYEPRNYGLKGQLKTEGRLQNEGSLRTKRRLKKERRLLLWPLLHLRSFCMRVHLHPPIKGRNFQTVKSVTCQSSN